MANKRLILASASPRRKELLKMTDIPFRAVPAKVAEKVLRAPARTVRRNALRKALEVAGRFPDGTVVGVDTVVVLRGRILGKPRNLSEAERFLGMLSAKRHSVFSGLAVVSGGRVLQDHERTEVFFDRISREEIRYYVKKYRPLDKAGAYGIQDPGASLFIRRITGDYYNVVGLPLNRLYGLLKALGYVLQG